MKKINCGSIKNGIYTKVVDFNKAVLWKMRMISLHKKVVESRAFQKVSEIRLEDPKRNERLLVASNKFKENMILMKVGQEEQYYISIYFFKSENIDPSRDKKTIL